jgi:hypothetical protein
MVACSTASPAISSCELAHTCQDILGVRWVGSIRETFCSHGWSTYHHPPASISSQYEHIRGRKTSRAIDVTGPWPPRVKGCRWCVQCVGPACTRHGGPNAKERQAWWREHRGEVMAATLAEVNDGEQHHNSTMSHDSELTS